MPESRALKLPNFIIAGQRRADGPGGPTRVIRRLAITTAHRPIA